LSQNNKRLPALSKNKPGGSRGGNSVVLEMLANKMADLGRQPNEEAFIVPLTSLEANAAQPRQLHDEERDRELAEDIQARGILQPILVRPLKSGLYQIVAGERRFRAARLAGLAEVPVVIKEYNDEQARYASMVENLQRQDLDPQDEGRFYDILNVEENISIRDIAAYIHRSPYYVQDRLNKYREQQAPANAAPLEPSAAANDSDENHKRNEKSHKLQKSQVKRIAPARNVNRFRDFLADTQGRLLELKPPERQELAEQLRELRRQMETIEYELLNS
jgi:ParB family chromosome partitioning protein